MVIGLGYDPLFLDSANELVVPVRPGLVDLPYTHFSVLQDLTRRLAAITAVNIDGSTLRDVPRGDWWQLDPRLTADEQLGPELYSSNDLDRGHLVRRRDPVWGELSIATQANRDTFNYPVCAPQWSTFNQSKALWLGLEDYILEHVRTFGHRMSVFTGCVFGADDPAYRGALIPRQFFKIAAWLAVDELAATGYLLDQSELLVDLELQPAPGPEVPPLGQFRTFQVPISDIVELTGLGSPALIAADRFTMPEPVYPSPVSDRWTELTSFADVQL